MKYLAIAFGALLTVLVETVFFYLLGFRSKRFIWTCVIINLLTNLILNLSLLLTDAYSNPNYNYYLLSGELIVVIIEGATYYLEDRTRLEVLPLTLSANILSYLTGLLYYYLLSLAGFSFF